MNTLIRGEGVGVACGSFDEVLCASGGGDLQQEDIHEGEPEECL